jgi:hypothetical protein
MLEKSQEPDSRPPLRQFPRNVPLRRNLICGGVLLFVTFCIISALGVSWGRKWLNSSSLGPLFIDPEVLNLGLYGW